MIKVFGHLTIFDYLPIGQRFALDRDFCRHVNITILGVDFPAFGPVLLDYVLHLFKVNHIELFALWNSSGVNEHC